MTEVSVERCLVNVRFGCFLVSSDLGGNIKILWPQRIVNLIALINVLDDVVESVVENEVSHLREMETASKDNGAEDEDMEVIDDLEEGSLAGSTAASGDIDFSEEEEEEDDDDEPSGSVTPSSSVSSKSESGLHLKEKVANCLINK